jgi:hypothetical protein
MTIPEMLAFPPFTDACPRHRMMMYRYAGAYPQRRMMMYCVRPYVRGPETAAQDTIFLGQQTALLNVMIQK